MAKSQNAFAFRDFDKDRILSRKFFSGLNLPTDKSDEEILQSFNTSSVEALEKATVDLVEIRRMIKDYIERVKHHALKLENINKKIAVRIVENGVDDSLRENFNRSKKLSDLYNEFTFDIGGLFNRTRRAVETFNALVDAIYRKLFAMRLKQARNKAGYTQKQVAQLTGISLSTMIAYENAQREPSLCLIRRLTKVLHIPADNLFA